MNISLNKIDPTKINLSRVDGIVFNRDSKTVIDGIEGVKWKINFMKSPLTDNDFIEKEGIGYKYRVCLIDEKFDLEIFDAIIGDPIGYANSFISTGEEGFFVKFSTWGKEVVDQFAKLHYSSRLQDAITSILNKKVHNE